MEMIFQDYSFGDKNAHGYLDRWLKNIIFTPLSTLTPWHIQLNFCHHQYSHQLLCETGTSASLFLMDRIDLSFLLEILSSIDTDDTTSFSSYIFKCFFSFPMVSPGQPLNAVLKRLRISKTFLFSLGLSLLPVSPTSWLKLVYVNNFQISYQDLSPECKTKLARSSLGCPTQIRIASSFLHVVLLPWFLSWMSCPDMCHVPVPPHGPATLIPV